MRKGIVIALLLLGSSSILLAGGGKKTTELKGVVTDNHGEPLAGVKIHIPSLEKDVYTDFDGHFSIPELPLKKQSIELTYVSFEEKKVQLDLEALNSSIHFELQSK